MRALFFGTPEFAVPSLDALADVAQIVGVVCQPDKPRGRGLEVQPPPVKARALQLGLPVIQPTKLRTGEIAAWVKDQDVDVALVVAYGRILPKEILDGPRKGCVNVHGSLLPRYRGAAPIQWSVIDGETETGVSLMVLDEGMDTGPVLARATIPIGPDETSGELAERLARLGADAVRTFLPKYVAGELHATPQDPALATHARMLTKDDGRIDWTMPARRIHDHVRGMSPWPGAFTRAAGKVVKVHAARFAASLATPAAGGAAPGTVILADKAHLLVATGDGALDLTTVQLEGRKPVRGVDWVMGRGVREGDRLE